MWFLLKGTALGAKQGAKVVRVVGLMRVYGEDSENHTGIVSSRSVHLAKLEHPLVTTAVVSSWVFWESGSSNKIMLKVGC